MSLEDQIARLERRLVREKNARKQAETLLEEKSRALYEQNTNLQENARLLEATVVSAKDGVMITTADLINGPQIIYVNKAFTKITGYTSEEVIGKTPRLLQGEETDRRELDRLKESLSQGKAFKGELKNYAKDGTSYWLDISIVPIKNDTGEVTHFTAVERDITEQKRLQAQMQEYTDKLELLRFDALDAKKKAEKANQAKTEFLANMSHELRTPMNGIIGMTEMLLDSGLDTEQREYAEILRGSGENLLAILNDILDISKIEAGELNIETVPYDIGTAVRQIIQLFTPLAADQGIDLLFEEDRDIPPVVRGDLGRVQQVLRNLISNAIKFTEHGHVRIITKRINRGVENQLYFAVEDTGIGIPSDKLQSIFEKFTQADSSVTRKFGGTGLGLAITQQLVGLMGGEIGVESIQGKGSTFWFVLPLDIADESSKAVNLYDENTSGNGLNLSQDLRILAVDDHPVNQIFIQKILKKFGLKNIDLADNGRAALDKIENNTYDIVLMDCQMPELDGYEATRQLRIIEEDQNKTRIPVVALTANAMVGDREKCIKAGMDDYLSKPIKPDKLMAILKKWTSSKDMRNYNASVQDHTDETTVVDMDHLSIFTDGDLDEEKELLNLFFDQADLSITQLEEALAAENSEAWQKAAHKLKGSAANLGANPLSQICAIAEKNFESGIDAKKSILRKITAELENVMYFFEQRHLIYQKNS